MAGYFDVPPSLIVTSPYLRTKQTAQATIERYPDVICEEWAIQEITYLSPAKYRNTSSMQRKPAADRFWQQAEPHYRDGRDSETFTEYIARVKAFITRLKESEQAFIAVFTHETVIKTVLWLALNAGIELTPEYMRQFRQFTGSFHFPNCAILQVEFCGDDGLRFNHVTSHLK